LPFIGHGVGLRVPHYPRALEGGIDVDWVEVISENFFGGGGRPRAVLERLRRDLPLVLHGVSLGVGSAGPPVPRYLAQLRQLVDDFEPAWVSDHLCWGHLDDTFSHDLLPLPYTEEALAHVVENVQRVQEALRRPILLENVSSYVSYAGSQLSEWEFLTQVAQRSGCLLLLDLNNILVSAHNHGFAPEQYLAGVPAERIQQLHLANHTQLPTHKFDDHRGPVPEAVWQLFDAAWRRFGPVSSLVEWDEDVPGWEELRAQQRLAVARAERLSRAEPGQRAETGQGAEGARSLAAAPRAPAAPTATMTAAPLAETQALFLDALRHPTGVAHWLEQGGTARRQQLERTFAGTAAFGAVQRLDVYANSYFYRLLGALRELFPRVAFLCGDALFHNLVTDYVLSCPSREPDLRRLGERLPAFLRSHPLAERWPLLLELAELEQALTVALDAPDGNLLTQDDLRAVPLEEWPELRLSFSPPTCLLLARWDLEQLEPLYAAGRREQALALTPASEPSVLLVGRRGHATYFRRLPAAEGRVLHELWRGASFGEACAALERGQLALEPAQVVAALGRWLAAGLLAH
jgi:uncharacterized protein (UPF0276 family)